MTTEKCHCSKSECLPLCPMCRKLTRLVPIIRSRLRQFAVGYGLVIRSDVLDDLAQEVLQGLARISQTPEKLSGLLACMCRHRLIDWMRRSARRSRYLLFGNRLNEFADKPQISNLALDVMMAMDRMPDLVRAVFLAHAIEERSREETALLLNLSLATVRKLYAVAIRILAKELAIEGPNKILPTAPKIVSPDDIAS
jgi:RNA polymerase sigma factor (sigma-70 family)